SEAPPGKAAWPAWCRNVEARTVNSRSASSGRSPSAGPVSGPENNTRTAASRLLRRTEGDVATALAAVTIASTSAGSRRRYASGICVMLSTSGRSQDGPTAGVRGTAALTGASVGYHLSRLSSIVSDRRRDLVGTRESPRQRLRNATVQPQDHRRWHHICDAQRRRDQT